MKLIIQFSYKVFDSASTAEKVYDSVDSLEFELTSMKIDLRFVPND